MTRFQRLTAVAFAATMLGSQAFAAALNAGDLYVYRVGTGSAMTSGAATAVFLDEYTISGSFVQSIAMPTVSVGANGMLTASSTASSEGLLTTSTDQKSIVLTGYNAAVGTAGVGTSTSAAVNRTVAVVDLTGNVNTTTKLSDASTGNNIRGVASTNGTDLWVSGATGGVRYTTVGSSTSTQLSTTVTNLRSVEIVNGQLYASDSSGTTNRLGAVGTGTPATAGQTITNLPGFATSTGSPYAFFFADLSSSVAGVDTLYVADDTSGISKYSLNNGTWTLKGTVGAAADTYRGLTGTVSANGTVSLFATGAGGSGVTGGGKLVSFSDTAGYNGGFTGTVTTLATAQANTAFRGVAYLAAVPSVPEPQTYAMMAMGLLAMGLMVRSRRNDR